MQFIFSTNYRCDSVVSRSLVSLHAAYPIHFRTLNDHVELGEQSRIALDAERLRGREKIKLLIIVNYSRVVFSRSTLLPVRFECPRPKWPHLVTIFGDSSIMHVRSLFAAFVRHSVEYPLIPIVCRSPEQTKRACYFLRWKSTKRPVLHDVTSPIIVAVNEIAETRPMSE